MAQLSKLISLWQYTNKKWKWIGCISVVVLLSIISLKQFRIHLGAINVLNDPYILSSFIVKAVLTIVFLLIIEPLIFNIILKRILNKTHNTLGLRIMFWTLGVIYLIFIASGFVKQLPGYVASVNIKGGLSSQQLIENENLSFFVSEGQPSALVIYSGKNYLSYSEAYQSLDLMYDMLNAKLNHGIFSADPLYDYIPLDAYEWPEIRFQCQSLSNILQETVGRLHKNISPKSKLFPGKTQQNPDVDDIIQYKHQALFYTLDQQINFLQRILNFFSYNNPDPKHKKMLKDMEALIEDYSETKNLGVEVYSQLVILNRFSNTENDNRGYIKFMQEKEDKYMLVTKGYSGKEYYKLSQVSATDFVSIYKNEGGAYASHLFIAPYNYEGNMDGETYGIRAFSKILIDKYKNYAKNIKRRIVK